MREIKLTQGKVALVDDGDYEQLSRYRWHTKRIKSGDGIFYAARNSRVGEFPRKRTILMHRHLLNTAGNVDHRDGNGLNCQRNNLRHCTQHQNGGNRKVDAGKRFKGTWRSSKNRFRAAITVHGKLIYLGSFIREEDAARAYDAKAKEVFGTFARLNFPSST